MDNNNRIIGLITDFGPKGSHYVAAMKAVIISINPEARIIDIHHTISSYSIIETSFIIKSIYKFFPQNSIFVVVVDPGVGSSRKILALKTKSNHFFIGPDNGIFWLAFAENGIKECIQIQNAQFYHQPVSDTFHGRDIMAPVGAYLSKNISLNKFG
ncbi:MAG: SAM-dependent chlorinase/fluorinase, partial [Candidatus Lokiarchaeota archaeon]